MTEFTGRDGTLVSDELPAWTFFRQWLKNPRAMASLSPSGRQLAREMVAQIPQRARRVVELGAGTGVFTRALLDHGIAPRDLLVVELNAEFHRLLERRFPGVGVVHGDARDLCGIAARTGFAHPGEVDAVVSGLGFLAMPRSVQQAILEAVFSVLGPGRPLIQFTYAPRNPLPQGLLDRLGLDVRRAGFAWRNMPPAMVYVYARRRARPSRRNGVGSIG
ncbi:MAG: methyltransferase domain-containing protein [Xanthomonadales bacterium]|nr:methyltransferase domain-containing protein [Xanthomonadales bacterium]